MTETEPCSGKARLNATQNARPATAVKVACNGSLSPSILAVMLNVTNHLTLQSRFQREIHACR